MSEDDATHAAASWATFHDPSRLVLPRAIEAHFLQDVHTHWGGCLVDETGLSWVSTKVPRDPPAWEGTDPESGWIGAVCGEPEELEGLLAAGETALRTKGMREVWYGGDPRHIHPGAPEDEEDWLEALEARGFERMGEVYDLFAPMADLPVREVPSNAGPADRKDREHITAFVDREFGGRWGFDTHLRLRVEKDPNCVIVVKEAGEIVAFTHVATLGHRMLMPNLNYALAYRMNIGGIGPVGVAASHRGRGLGRVVMEASIEALRRAGVEGIVVDWTNLLDFYGIFGFQPSIRYLLYRKRLSE